DRLNRLRQPPFGVVYDVVEGLGGVNVCLGFLQALLEGLVVHGLVGALADALKERVRRRGDEDGHAVLDLLLEQHRPGDVHLGNDEVGLRRDITEDVLWHAIGVLRAVYVTPEGVVLVGFEKLAGDGQFLELVDGHKVVLLSVELVLTGRSGGVGADAVHNARVACQQFFDNGILTHARGAGNYKQAPFQRPVDLKYSALQIGQVIAHDRRKSLTNWPFMLPATTNGPDVYQHEPARGSLRFSGDYTTRAPLSVMD